MARLNARPIIADHEPPFVAFRSTTDFYFAPWLVHVLDCIGKQVLKYLLNAGWLRYDGWQLAFDTNGNIWRRSDEINNVPYDLTDVNTNRFFPNATDPRIFKDTVNQVSHAVYSVDEEPHMFPPFVIEL